MVNEQVFDLMFSLNATEDQLDYKTIYGSAKQGWMSHKWNERTDSIVPLLDTIIDELEEVIQRFYMYDVHFMHKDALEFAQLLKKECKALNKAMEDFRNFKKSKKFKSLIIEVNTYEEEADQLLMHVIRDLHTTDCENTMRVMVWSRIFEHMENCADATEHAADCMSTILLKNV